ncbi:MAG: hypothetical protein R2789_14410 [Microthrixaceae bacterium]
MTELSTTRRERPIAIAAVLGLLKLRVTVLPGRRSRFGWFR